MACHSIRYNFQKMVYRFFFFPVTENMCYSIGVEERDAENIDNTET